MVFIHGGAFLAGGAQQYQPYILLNEEVVLVVLQYRLGIFGLWKAPIFSLKTSTHIFFLMCLP